MDRPVFAQHLADSFRDERILVIANPGEGYPPLVLFHPAKGLVSFDWMKQEKDELAQRNELRSAARAFVTDSDGAHELPRTQFLLGPSAGVDSVIALVGNLPDQEIDEDLYQSVLSEFTSVGWVFDPKRATEDPGREEREVERTRLDEMQSAIATEENKGILVLTGPAGSGKSLVLARRAEFLSEEHPEWVIQMVCYNRGLVPYLRGLVRHLPNVRVDTFPGWLQERGYRMNISNCTSSAIGLDRLRREGIDRYIDALLIDEFQDFCAAWLELMFDSVHEGRGGVAMAGDEQQSLYVDLDLDQVLQGREVEHRRLGVPYRSTRQILEVVGILDPAQAVPGIEHAPDGEPVEVVWTTGGLQEKGRAIAHLILEHRSMGRSWSDFVVLATSNYMIRSLTGTLAASGVKVESRYSRLIGPDDDPWSNSVKVMTVHTGKGLEYSITFVVGLDDLKEPSEVVSIPDRKDTERFVRVNLVGPTRSKDLLYLVASKDNTYIRRVKEQSSGVEVHRWPDDYLEVSGG